MLIGHFKSSIICALKVIISKNMINLDIRKQYKKVLEKLITGYETKTNLKISFVAFG